MASLNNPAWLQWRAFTPVNKLRTYVQLPAFSFTPNWLGVSELVVQYNFSATQNFYLKNRPTRPVGVNYVLCIKYRVGDTVYRYKLWSHSDATGLEEVPLYSSQLIKTNFVLEVWSAGATASQATAINIITSVVQVPSDISDLDDVALATGAEFTNFNVVQPTGWTLPTALTGGTGYWRWLPSGIIDVGGNLCVTWTQNGSLVGSNFTDLGTAAAIIAGPSGVNSLAIPNFRNSTVQTAYGGIFFVFRIPAYPGGVTNIFKVYRNGTTSALNLRVTPVGDNKVTFSIQNVDAGGVVTASAESQPIGLNEWTIGRLLWTAGTGSSFTIAGLDAVTVGVQEVVSYDRFELNLAASNIADFADIINYNSSDVGAVNNDLLNQVESYLMQTYPTLGSAFPINFTPANNAAAWLDNV